MATFTAGKNAKFYIVDSGSTERDISNVVQTVTLPISADTSDVSALGDQAKSNLATLKDSTVSIDGHRDATVEGYLFGVIGTSTTYAYCPEGSASGKVKFSGTIVPTSLQDSSDVGDTNKFSFAAQGSGTVTRTVL